MLLLQPLGREEFGLLKTFAPLGLDFGLAVELVLAEEQRGISPPGGAANRRRL